MTDINEEVMILNVKTSKYFLVDKIGNFILIHFNFRSLIEQVPYNFYRLVFAYY